MPEEKLISLNNTDLLDIVKNYRQYKFDEQTRHQAIQILEERGINQNYLKETGYLENNTYNTALQYYLAYTKNSRNALVFYIIFVISFLVFILIFAPLIKALGGFVAVCSLVSFYIYLILSFINQYRFYGSIKKAFSLSAIWIYLLLGAPIYLASYFYYKDRLRSELDLIR